MFFEIKFRGAGLSPAHATATDLKRDDLPIWVGLSAGYRPASCRPGLGTQMNIHCVFEQSLCLVLDETASGSFTKRERQKSRLHAVS